jgi:hypothetical protein
MLDPAVSVRPRNPNFANDFHEYLGEFEAICETAFARNSLPLGGLVMKITEGRKSLSVSKAKS